MLGKTHALGGIAAFEVVAFTSGFNITKEETVLGLAFCIIGALAPDIDHAKSKISKSDIVIGGASEAVCTFTKHRGITHTPLGCLFITILAFLLVRTTVSYANANAAFMFALIVFCVVHFCPAGPRLKKFGGVLAIASFFEYSKIAEHIAWLPSMELPGGYEYFIALCVFAGTISHLFLDMLNPEGVMLFYPFKKRLHLARVTTGTKAESGFIVALTMAISCVAVRYGIPYINTLLTA